MRIHAEIHIHHHGNDGEILSVLNRIDQRTATMALDIGPLLEKVTNLETAQASALALLNEIAQWIRDLPAGATQEQIDAVAARVDQLATNAGDAVVANTDVDPTPPTP